MSVAAMAKRLHMTPGHVHNIEQGRRTATPAVILAYAQLGDDLDRRNALTSIAALAAAPVLLQHGFAAVLYGSPRPAEEWEARVIGYGRDYMTLGAEALRRKLSVDLVELQQHVEQSGLWQSAARLLAVFGKTSGQPREAMRWYRLAVAAADRSGDLGTRVWVRSRASLALAYEGALLPTAARLAEDALALDERPTLGRLNALVTLAHVHGARGDHAGAVEWDEQARRLFDLVASAEQVSDFAVPEWRMATFRSMLYARLGDAPRAEAAQLDADRSRPSTLERFATHIELHRALAAVRAGDWAEGVAYARRAMAALPADRQSLTLRMLLSEVERPRRDGGAVG